MSAIASMLTAVLRVRESARILLPRGAYSETRELLERFGSRVDIGAWTDGARHAQAATSIVWIDSCVPFGFDDFKWLPTRDFDLVVFDTTCFSHGSRRIVQVVDWARRAQLPIALVRSHAKLDCLGIEYGRLGSIQYVGDEQDGRHAWLKPLVAETHEAIRLFGAAALPSHFPPFAGHDAYRICTARRTAAILRNTRRAARRLVGHFRLRRGAQVSAQSLSDACTRRAARIGRRLARRRRTVLHSCAAESSGQACRILRF